MSTPRLSTLSWSGLAIFCSLSFGAGSIAAVQADASTDPACWLFASGSDGPRGTFDWCVPAGQTLILDTSSAILSGGPHCDGSQVQNVVGGIVEARNVSIGPGAVLRVIGPNPLVVFASGTVRIEGTIDLSGTSSPGVTTINTTNLPEPGAPGQAGGGDGGTGNPNTASPTPMGGNGLGAFGTEDGGGRGGETGWNNVSAFQLEERRGAGGGGGTFGANQAQEFGSIAQFGAWDQTFIGLDAEDGFANQRRAAQGAITGPEGPLGGRVGPRPFTDGNPINDFYGYGLDPQTGAIVVGELAQPWAGAGGGAGGNASFVGVGGTWPPPFNPTGDEKGAGGGGGGGSLEILALGDIVFGRAGLILCRGGDGGWGENTLFLNRVGGSSGGGSGGHVILQTAGVIDFRSSLGLASVEPGAIVGGILATGGQGGGNAGGQVQGDSKDGVQTLAALDSCPRGYPEFGANACLGHLDGVGGDGGPGVVQLHTRNGFNPRDPSILLPAGRTIRDLCKPLPIGSDGSIVLQPRFPGLPGDEALSGTRRDEQRWQEFLRLRPGEGLMQRMR